MADRPDAERLSLRALLETGLRAMGEPSSPVQIERWERLALLVDRWSQRINLTGHQGPLAIAERLLLEAVALHRALPSASSIADLGSGAGIPGFPLALCRPRSRLLLIESRERRHHFQRAVIRELGLGNVRAVRGRAEALPVELCGGVVSQAFAKPSRALAWMVPWASVGGWVALATRPDADLRGFSHPELVNGRLVPYGAPAGPPRAAWIAKRSRPGTARERSGATRPDFL